MLAAGVATRTTGGNVIDHFRDRIVFPLTNPDGTVLGFIGRRHPDADYTQGPKYLNTRTTLLFHKSAHLFGGPFADATPVLVEVPMDAIAVTLAGRGQLVGR